MRKTLGRKKRKQDSFFFFNPLPPPMKTDTENRMAKPKAYRAAPRGPAAPQGPASTCWPGPRVPALGSAFSPGVPGTTNPSLAAQRLQEMRLGLEPHADGPLERARFLTVLNRW